MNLVEKRDFIHNHLYQSDEGFINEVYNKLRELISSKGEIVGSRPGGEAITKKELVIRAKKAEEDIAAGRYISQEDLEKEVENW